MGENTEFTNELHSEYSKSCEKKMLFGFIPIHKAASDKTFLVFNTACFGDNLVCNSLCQNIKRIYPDSKIVFIADKPFAEVAQHQKDVDEVVIYDKKGEHKGLKGFIKFIKDFKYKNAYEKLIGSLNRENVEENGNFTR